MCFETDTQSEMTQIHLWQSYQATFLKYQQGYGNLIAGDFIKNVSNTFTGASAQVAAANKYVIRGIRPRQIAHDIHGKELVKCCWRTNPSEIPQEVVAIFANNQGKECGEFFLNGERLLEHILTSHMKIPKKAPASVNGDAQQPSQTASKRAAFDFAAADASLPYACQWSTCTHRPSGPSVPVSLALLARHINTHLPDNSSNAELKRQHHRDSKDGEEPIPSNRVWHRTMADEHNDAAGLPLGSALVLRNVARGVRKMAPADSTSAAAAEDKALPADGEQPHRDNEDDEVAAAVPEAPVPASAELMKKIFDPIREKLFFAMAHNPTLSHYLGAVIRAIAAGGG